VRHHFNVLTFTPCRRATACASPLASSSDIRPAHHAAVCIMRAIKRTRRRRARRTSPDGYLPAFYALLHVT
ncbi:MAG: hypothetical protein FWD73_17090, partial [Polyangiaceae bacterium]|nr:hypothetical protein [Polyangiaceae bacterium]